MKPSSTVVDSLLWSNATEQLCAIKIFEREDREFFDTETRLLALLSGSGHSPTLFDYTKSDGSNKNLFNQNVSENIMKATTQPPEGGPAENPSAEKLYIVMERGLVTLQDRIDASMSLNCRFHDDVTIPDGSIMKPNTAFRKTWLLQNVGLSAWAPEPAQFESAELECTRAELVPVASLVSTDLRAKHVPIPYVAPGDHVEVSIDLVAPEEEDLYKTTFRLADQRTGKSFGDSFWVEFEVQASEDEGEEELASDTKERAHRTPESDCAVEEGASAEGDRGQLSARSEGGGIREPAGTNHGELEAVWASVLQEEAEGQTKGPFRQSEVRLIMTRLLDALAVCHSHGYVFMDMKPTNVMQFPGGRWSLIDFGGAKRMEVPMRPPFDSFTHAYMSPEMAEVMTAWFEEDDEEACEEMRLLPTAAMDVFSLGLTFLEMISTDGAAAMDSVREKMEDVMLDESEAEWYEWLGCSSEVESVIERRLADVANPLMRSLARGMLQRNPDMRWSVDKCRQHPWLLDLSDEFEKRVTDCELYTWQLLEKWTQLMLKHASKGNGGASSNMADHHDEEETTAPETTVAFHAKVADHLCLLKQHREWLKRLQHIKAPGHKRVSHI
ncbi:hypothetical protein CYMTET_12158 [Cymbomonas tetramitiformis]|uniref:Protein kinase domain-containing protein n=1 Tax=Cymbomonas tetramitiformis TaxID=36881 RepID=A0AAE0GL79_9CHLO|nr:hypothetical protein CYMTET_12158 [Cymbomonas tetramitiformis]